MVVSKEFDLGLRSVFIHCVQNITRPGELLFHTLRYTVRLVLHIVFTFCVILYISQFNGLKTAPPCYYDHVIR